MKRNEIVVIIPSYEPSARFVEYAKTLINAHIGRLVVVNDGSCDKYDDVFSALKALDRCHVIEYPENHGKGYALKKAFEYAKENFDERYTFVTADCDGQHLVKDVLNVVSAANEFGDSFVLGVRDFSKSNVPKRSRLGNVNTRRLFKFLYGVKISDTQTGLRAFPYSMLDELLKIKGDRFEYEMNQLVMLHKHNVPIREVPIETVYEKKPDDVETVSHYQTFKDSMRVLRVLLTNLSWFMIASVASVIVEQLLLFLCLQFLPANEQNSVVIFSVWFVPKGILSFWIARVMSSIPNVIMNYKISFNGQSKKSIVKYYVLWLFLLICGMGYTQLFTLLIDNAFAITVLTAITTMLMSLLSYQVQTRWVFADGKKKDGKFWGLYSKFVRFMYNLGTKPYTSLVARDPYGAVYVCRHLNMHGPLTTASKLGFDCHMMIFSVFTTFKECFTHFRDYNFMTVKKMHRIPSTILAFAMACFLVPLIKSMDGIPVYRKNTKSIITLKKSLKFLEMHENIILFPDIEYTADADKESDIYSGFLLLEKMYYKKTGRHLRFIPLVIDDENRVIIEKPPIRFRNGDYKQQSLIVKEKIMLAIGSVKNDDSQILKALHQAESEAVITQSDAKS
ncbi:MAG: glycosyltransferase family 2 protein [Christensenellaceae bacterium]